ncbi:MAG: hypothetical protein A3B74_05110 [Candidatus Kerfeldbacteria bacterium RIFCSPHIGHO2_02_FULL_42_14]|uniref:Sodium/calcium exchanger membrane region domain-containing protein n=1 Tax=Candidatus Kerfeldbacteria bacterium RIFCSPHIGHO2_02_FULL_42_14 TaxID=1798540 RepID=A0A1G2AU37_9BACT|nr:MAG: hypothetical protein A3B74_05110 [Candidatus Kerfeldbacteria bacterium RIFCSPHIGHO2_02_FULL_42_14]OGY81625.1 MAG: hypothetical protein A3E60_02145 [Candidatus Kerfeldbacteria bacterium RIFCSPHIGHO2_12_FULL_42_13]OGY83227.1 MAG: hypothetical protein A3I91_03550 [Candidatus Kerfeldbacteria bacterium RIFCSPLOWO2_02_FULL_42_19]
MLIFWIIVFLFSLAAIVKGADWLLTSSEKIGLALGLTPFIVGVTIVGAGTSLPELASSLIAVFEGALDVPVANAVGSNLFNILIIAGASAVVAKKLAVTKDIVDLDIPLIFISTVFLILMSYDKQVNFAEAILLLVGYGIYLAYTVLYHDDQNSDELKNQKSKRPQIRALDIVILILGFAALILGAKFLVRSVIELSTLLNIATGVITVTAVAAGTSLPELAVSVKAGLQKKADIALGNIFGSNVFNAFVVVGIPGLFADLNVDEKTYAIGLPVLIITTLLFAISGISKRLHIWEGLFYILLYIVFTVKLFGVI